MSREWSASLLQQPAPRWPAFEIWGWYYDETEAFDRTICPIDDRGIAVPVRPWQRKQVYDHARAVERTVLWLLSMHEVSGEESAKAKAAACAVHSERCRKYGVPE